jgi:hypothetical protein
LGHWDGEGMLGKCCECDENVETREYRADTVPVPGHLDWILGERLIRERLLGKILFGEMLLGEELLKTTSLLSVSWPLFVPSVKLRSVNAKSTKN